jgi:catechol 2,3-dioxygenase-like lactoylglutathione lyase family enzyme
MFTHICVGANDLAESKKFYDAVLGAIGLPEGQLFEDRACVYGTDSGRLIVTKPRNGEPATMANGGTIGFGAATTDAVDAFHAAGLANGGTDEGAPGRRPLSPTNAYGAYLRDPVGNKICVFSA